MFFSAHPSLRRLAIAFALLCLAAAVLALPVTGAAAVASPDAPAECSMAGAWISDRGLLVLRQSGNTFTGTFTNPPGGQLTGVLDASNYIVGTWTTPGEAGEFDITPYWGPYPGQCEFFTGAYGTYEHPRSWSWEGTAVKARLFLPAVTR